MKRNQLHQKTVGLRASGLLLRPSTHCDGTTAREVRDPLLEGWDPAVEKADGQSWRPERVASEGTD